MTSRPFDTKGVPVQGNIADDKISSQTAASAPLPKTCNYWSREFTLLGDQEKLHGEPKPKCDYLVCNIHIPLISYTKWTIVNAVCLNFYSLLGNAANSMNRWKLVIQRIGLSCILNCAYYNGAGNGLVLSGNTLLPDPMLNQICHLVVLLSVWVFYMVLALSPWHLSGRHEILMFGVCLNILCCEPSVNRKYVQAWILQLRNYDIFHVHDARIFCVHVVLHVYYFMVLLHFMYLRLIMKAFCPGGCHYYIRKSVCLTNVAQYTKGLCVLVSMANLTLYMDKLWPRVPELERGVLDVSFRRKYALVFSKWISYLLCYRNSCYTLSSEQRYTDDCLYDG